METQRFLRRRSPLQRSRERTDKRGMRHSKHSTIARFSALIAALGLSFALGCNEILSELDAGAGKSKAKSSGDKAKAQPETPQSKLQKYYEDQRRQKRQAELDPDNEIVTCNLAGSITMTRKFDCQSRGGTVR